MSAPSEKQMERLMAAADRFQEAHFWIHGLETYYHQAEPFRWHLNVFLKSIKEVVPLIKKSLQNKPDFVSWFKSHDERLASHKLLCKLAESRDYIVHHGMLSVASTGSIGITEGRGLKLGFNIPFRPDQDSDEAMDNFVWSLAKAGDTFGFLCDDEDSIPCVERYWRLPGVDEDIIDACSRAWIEIGISLASVLEWCGEERPDFNLNCRHSSQRLHFKLYQRKLLRERLLQHRADPQFQLYPNASDACDLSAQENG